MLRYDGLHVAEFLFQSSEHLFGYLELNGTWMVLDGESIRAQVLYECLVLPIIVALAHLEHHVLVTSDLLSVRNRCWEEAIWRTGQVPYL